MRKLPQPIKSFSLARRVSAQRRESFGSRNFDFGITLSHQPCANSYETKRAKPGARVDRTKLRQIDLHWHDLRHEGACRLLADGVDIRIIQLMLGHSSVQQTQRYLNVTDEELRKGLEVSWKRRTLKAVAGGQNG